MKKIDVIAAELTSATQSVDGLEQLGRRLAAEHREFAAHVRNGISHEDIGQSHIEEQIRLYLAFTLHRSMWEHLVAQSKGFAEQDRNAIAPMFSPWGYLHSDLVENIGEGFGWTGGKTPTSLSSTTLAQRLGMIVSSFSALTPTQTKQLEIGLGLEEGASVPRTGGCYVATAVYGNYDAPEVLVLRRWRDSYLMSFGAGRIFVQFYYATSPHLVRAFGSRDWFVVPSRVALNRLVRKLRKSGYSD